MARVQNQAAEDGGSSVWLKVREGRAVRFRPICDEFSALR